MNRESLDRLCERGILGCVLAVLLWGPLASGAVYTQDLLVPLCLTAVALALWCGRLWLNERPKLLLPPVSWAVLVFVAYAVGRYFTCDIEYVGRVELLRVLLYAAVFFLVLNQLHGQEHTQVLAFSVIFLALGVALCALWQYLARANVVPSLTALLESLVFSHKQWFFRREYVARASGTYINPNHLAGLLEMLVPLALAYVLVGRARPVTKVLLGYAALMMLAGLAVSGSRGGWVAGTGSLLVFFGLLATQRSHRLPALALLVVLVAGAVYFAKNSRLFQARMQPTFAEGRLELDLRAELWEATTQMWQDHRWWGVGPGHFDARFGMYRPPSVQLRADRAHNEYLNLLADWGVIGAGLIAAVLVTLAAGLVRTWRFVRRSEQEFKSNRSNKFALVIGAGSGLVALLIHSCVDFNLQIPANAILAAGLCALLASHIRFATEGCWFGGGRATKVLVSAVCVVVAVFFLQQTVRLGGEYYWLERAGALGAYSTEKIQALSRAHAFEPNNAETAFAIAECYRTQSFEGGHDFEDQEGYEKLAQRALTWYARGIRANPYDGYNYLGTGQCLDYINRYTEAQPYFDRAEQLDPNRYWTVALIGRHYVEIGDYGAARRWFERSLRLKWEDNEISTQWLERLNGLLARAAAPATR
jgi:O-antigen ligase